jgi:hypothetical protein
MSAPFINGVVREGYGHQCYGRRDTLRMVMMRKGNYARLDSTGHAVLGSPFTEYVLFELEMPDTPESREGLKGWDRPYLGKELGNVEKFEDGVAWVDGEKDINEVVGISRREA